MHEIKVAYVLNTTVMGGGNISFVNMISGLKKLGVRIYVIYPEKSIDKRFYDLTNEIVDEYYSCPLVSMVTPRADGLLGLIKNIIKRFLYYIKEMESIFLLDKIICGIKPDIIHTNVGVIHAGFFVAKKRGIPHIWHLREYQTEDFGWNILPSKKRFMNYLRNSYNISITKDIFEHFNLTSGKDECIYNGCFFSSDFSYQWPKEKFFLCCNRISKEKCPEDIIEGFSKFYKQNRDWKLCFIGFGDDEYINFLKNKCDSLECGHAVEFRGYVDDVKPYMDRASALIVASRYEGFGRMTAEALIRGCLVIGRNTGGTREILNNAGGLLFNNVSELYDDLQKVKSLSDKAYREIMEPAQQYAFEKFTIEKNVEKVYSKYLDIMEINDEKKNRTIC